MAWEFKDSNVIATYSVDWSSALGVDAISTSSWAVPAGITEVSSANSTTEASILVSGGTNGVRYDLTNTIVTATGQTLVSVVTLFIRDREAAPALDATVGGADADSYVTEVEFLDYALKRGWTINTGVEGSLREAALYIDREFDFIGNTVTKAQALAWPRYTSKVDANGWAIDSDEIPEPVRRAAMEMAYIIHQGDSPLETISKGFITEETVKAGPVSSKKVFTGGSTKDQYPQIGNLLTAFLASGGNQTTLVRG